MISLTLIMRLKWFAKAAIAGFAIVTLFILIIYSPLMKFEWKEFLFSILLMWIPMLIVLGIIAIFKKVLPVGARIYGWVTPLLLGYILLVLGSSSFLYSDDRSHISLISILKICFGIIAASVGIWKLIKTLYVSLKGRFTHV
jgi:hypothetical protein